MQLGVGGEGGRWGGILLMFPRLRGLFYNQNPLGSVCVGGGGRGGRWREEKTLNLMTNGKANIQFNSITNYSFYQTGSQKHKFKTTIRRTEQSTET